MDLKPEDFGEAEYEGCNEHLVFSRPDIVETNTLGATPIVLDEYQLGSKAYEINKLACEIARKVCAKYDEPSRLRFVADSIGTTTKSLSLTDGITFDELIDHYYEQLRGLLRRPRRKNSHRRFGDNRSRGHDVGWPVH